MTNDAPLLSGTVVSRPQPWHSANPWIAGLLAYMLPGAGHLYQGRTFKGLIYLVCITGSYFGGVCLGEGTVVYPPPNPKKMNWSYIGLGFAAQMGVGIGGIPALIQTKRANDAGKLPDNPSAERDRETGTYPFDGQVVAFGGGGKPQTIGAAVGTVEIHSLTFNGTVDGQQRTLRLSAINHAETEPAFGPTPRRQFVGALERTADQPPHLSYTLQGTLARPFLSWYSMPPSAQTVQDLTGRLGKRYEMALVFTWVAGLLNLLAIWDCVEGPAYGFGDEDDYPLPHQPPAA